MAIDAATRRNLELTETLSGARGGSLLASIDRSVTAAGARELASRLAAPLTDVAVIADRHASVEFFSKDSELRRGLREALRAAPDLSRALARLSVQRGGPRDLGNIRDAIKAESASCATGWGKFRWPVKRWARRKRSPWAWQRYRACLTGWSSLVDEPPYFIRDGGFIRPGVHAPLDEVRALAHESRRVIATLSAAIAAKAAWRR